MVDYLMNGMKLVMEQIGVSTRFTGAGTSTLTLSHALSPEDHGNQYYSRITFTPDNVSSGGTSGNILNNFVDSTPVSISVAPELFISAGITTATVSVNQEASFSCLGGINRDKVSSYDDGQESSIAYQWYLDGSALSDGTLQKHKLSNNCDKNFWCRKSYVNIPDDAQMLRFVLSVVQVDLVEMTLDQMVVWWTR